MSDAKKIATVILPARAVIRNRFDRLYYLYEYVQGSGWSPIESERGYAHSTSAYARLGRITNQDSQRSILQVAA